MGTTNQSHVSTPAATHKVLPAPAGVACERCRCVLLPGALSGLWSRGRWTCPRCTSHHQARVQRHREARRRRDLLAKVQRVSPLPEALRNPPPSDAALIAERLRISRQIMGVDFRGRVR